VASPQRHTIQRGKRLSGLREAGSRSFFGCLGNKRFRDANPDLPHPRAAECLQITHLASRTHFADALLRMSCAQGAHVSNDLFDLSAAIGR
jgi:hypothetical protein